MFDAQNPDRLLNAGYKTFAFSLDGVALQQWLGQIENVLFGVGSRTYCPGQVTCLLESSAFSIESVFPADPRTVEAAVGTSAVDLSLADRYRDLARTGAARVSDRLLPLVPRDRLLLLAASVTVAVIAIALVRQAALVALIASLGVGFATYAILMTSITVVLPRYIAPLDLVVWLINAISLIFIIEFLAKGRSEARVSSVYD
jgi:hypothetical protein